MPDPMEKISSGPHGRTPKYAEGRGRSVKSPREHMEIVNAYALVGGYPGRRSALRHHPRDTELVASLVLVRQLLQQRVHSLSQA
jgi:hypothetical protein